MVGRKYRSCYKKKRTNKGFSGVRPWSIHKDQPALVSGCDKDKQPSTSTCTGTTDDSSDQISASVGASGHKLSDRGFSSISKRSSTDSDAENEKCMNTSYRLIDVSLLSSMFSDVHKFPESQLLSKRVC